ncbi:MAG: hypothetical protein PHS07_02870 [Patescibacteria group bacterium]|jgi:hypothetical protein|nr:hypothetical protein [Patescibacteria group bacterium]
MDLDTLNEKLLEIMTLEQLKNTVRELRKKIFKEANRYSQIGASIYNHRWITLVNLYLYACMLIELRE